MAVSSAKCGPDYIDPMFHRRITASGGNLDPFFFSPDTLNYLLEKYGSGHAVSVIEGVMGYYDGLGLSDDASTSTVARLVCWRFHFRRLTTRQKISSAWASGTFFGMMFSICEPDAG